MLKLKSVLKIILDSKKWENMEELLNLGKTKTSPGFLASVNAEFSSKKNGISFRMEKDFSKKFRGI